jgi:hypothetical protein
MPETPALPAPPLSMIEGAPAFRVNQGDLSLLQATTLQAHERMAAQNNRCIAVCHAR